jgi:tetratricopeptide (TPR) repeat protein
MMVNVFSVDSRFWDGVLGFRHLTAKLLTGLIVVCLGLLVDPVAAQDGIDHGRTGTLNHDYFAAIGSPDTHLYWLVGDAEHNHLKVALEDLRSGRYSKAVYDLDFLLQRFINHPEALHAMEAVAMLTRRPLAAAPYFEKAIAIYPQYALTHAQYGRYLSKLGRHDAAVASLKRAVELEPMLAAAHAWLAEAYTRMGETQLARETAERARELGYQGKI